MAKAKQPPVKYFNHIVYLRDYARHLLDQQMPDWEAEWKLDKLEFLTDPFSKRSPRIILRGMLLPRLKRKRVTAHISGLKMN
jgi:hypothetical protein